MARPPKAKAIERLKKVLNEIAELKKWLYDSPAFTRWHRNARIAIINAFGRETTINAFGHETTQIEEFDNTRYGPRGGWPDSAFPNSYVRGLEEAEALLESMTDEVEEYWEEDEESPNTSDTRLKTAKDTTKVFVIHGHDEAAQQKVARFLEKLELEPVILHEQANRGHTIIEKLEDHSDVGFALVLLTPDDVGAPRDKQSDLSPRARQNVILELGIFIGKLKRGRVCILRKHEVEIPSDYHGVVYTDFDDRGAWEKEVIKELKAAGFKVDANRLV